MIEIHFKCQGLDFKPESGHLDYSLGMKGVSINVFVYILFKAFFLTNQINRGHKVLIKCLT